MTSDIINQYIDQSIMTEAPKRHPDKSIQSYDLLRKHHRFLRESDEEEDDPRHKVRGE